MNKSAACGANLYAGKSKGETNIDDDLLKVAKRKVRPDSELGPSLAHAWLSSAVPPHQTIAMGNSRKGRSRVD